MECGESKGTVGRCIRVARDSDLAAITAVHCRAFPGFFLTQLGPSFLLLYYSTLRGYGRSVLLVAQENSEVRGFVAGFLDPRGFYAGLLDRKVRLALAVAPKLLRHHGIAARLWQDFRHAGREARGVTPPDAAELSSLGVDPSFRGLGLGEALVREFNSAAGKAGASLVYLATDAVGNDAVNLFYQRLGFELYRRFTSPPARLMNEYRISLPGERRSCAERS